MCGPSNIDDALSLIHEARIVADGLTGGFLPIPLAKAKAISIATPRGFNKVAGVLANQLRGAAKGPERDAVRAAVDTLNVDWHNTTPEQRRRLIDSAMAKAGRELDRIPGQLEVPLNKAAEKVILATRSDARQRQGLSVGAKMNEVDQRVSDYIVSSQSNFVTFDSGRRAKAFGEEARSIVADGIQQGLGRKAIAADLAKAAEGMVNKHPFYWEVIASAFVGQGRSFSQMSAYSEAGITRYEVHAILDEETTPTCRYLNGKTFSVGDALDKFDEVRSLKNPMDIKNSIPWVRQSTDPDTGQSFLYVDRGGNQTSVAEVIDSGEGEKDNTGRFRSLLSNRGLKEAGIGFPPYHGLCRTTTLAVV